MLTVYTSNTCAYCKMVKKYLTAKKVEYEEVDISDNDSMREKLKNLTGLTSVPVTTRGDKFVVGFNTSELSNLIA